ncbi:fibroblast growth factor-binding protein 1-like [Epinephelus lanceolatus]
MKAMCEATESHKKQLYAQQHESLSIINCLLKGDMLLLKTFTPLLMLAFLGQQVSLSSAARNKNRGADKTVTIAPPGSGDKLAASVRGKFPRDKMQCTWVAKDVGDTVKLMVKCEDPVARIKGGYTDLQCEYNGKPQSCPGYHSNNKGFWKQVSRAFKKLKTKVCSDERALVKASVCKRAPRGAHFKLDIFSSVVSAQSGGDELTEPTTPRSTSTSTAVSPACTKRANHQKTAEETCSGSWASVCNFFMSLLQSDDC